MCENSDLHFDVKSWSLVVIFRGPSNQETVELPATLDLDARRHTDTLQGANKRMLHVQILARVELNPKTRMTARLLKCNAEGT